MRAYIQRIPGVLCHNPRFPKDSRQGFSSRLNTSGMRPCLMLFLLILWSGAATAETLITVKSSAIHPTQPAIGYAEVNYSLAHYREQPRALFNDFCKDNGAGKVTHFDAQSTLAKPDSFRCADVAGTFPDAVKTAVLAPDGQVYLTDGHHSLSAYRASSADDFSVTLRVTHDLRDLPSMTAFWDYLQQHRLVWLTGAQGNVAVQALPQQVGLQSMRDDPYRSLIYFLRGVAYDRPENSPPFLEFYLGAWLQGQLPITPADTASQQAYFALLQRAAALLTQAPSSTHSLPDTTSPTLQQLGQLTKMKDGKLKKLNQPGGKLSLLFSATQA